MSKKSSFKTKLKEKSSRLIAIESVCRSAATSTKYSCAKIPTVEFVIKGLPNFPNASPKRTAIFRNIVEVLGEISHKIPSYADTRWLVCHQSIIIILINWDNIVCFLLVVISERVKKATELPNKMQTTLTNAYFLFLKDVINIFNFYNVTFQKRETMTQELQSKSADFLHWILRRYLKPSLHKPDLFFQIFRNVYFSDSNNQVALEDIDVRDETKSYCT